jgi:hypothetical protein
MNRWPIIIFQAVTETERRHNVYSRVALPATVNCAMGWGTIAGNKETPLDLSIAKARGAWRIFEVKHLQYILFRRGSAGASRIASEKAEVGCATVHVFD